MILLAESKQLQESQDLFELYVSDYLMLQRCSEELLYLKALWDMAGAVSHVGIQALLTAFPESTNTSTKPVSWRPTCCHHWVQHSLHSTCLCVPAALSIG